MSLAERLKEARLDKGWKKVDLKRAAKLNSASTLTELENGTITESPQIPAIANALGVESMWLKYGKGRKHVSESPGPFGALAMRAAAAVNCLSSNEQIRIVHILEMQTIEAEHAEAINGAPDHQYGAGNVRNPGRRVHRS